MGVQQHGLAFGSGIYFADQFDKSIAYSRPSPINNLDEESNESQNIQPRRYIFVCEVALGRIVKYEQTPYNMNYNAIGNQKQLKEIFELLKKADEEVNDLEDQVMDMDEDDDSDEEYKDQIDDGDD